MARKPRSQNRVTHSVPSGEGQARILTHQEVLDEAMGRLTQGLTLPRPEDTDYRPEDLLGVLLYAAAHQTTIEQAAQALEQAPHPNTVRGATAPLRVEQLETELNEVLASTWPKSLLRHPLEIAIDLKLIPYYGQAQPGEEDFLLSGPARKGTTTFFGYASIYVIKKNKRFTFALAAVRRSEGLVGVLRRLLERFFHLGGQILCLYLDRQFYSVEVLRFLIEEKDIPLVMAVPQKGKSGGIKGLIAREGPGLFPYTVRSPKKGRIALQIAIVGKYLKGRWGKHGRKFYAYVVHRFPFAFSALFEKYRYHFGIESSHRIWEQGRGHTASRRANLRLLLMGLAVLLHNLWVWLRWAVVSWPRRGGRRVFHRLLTFKRLLLFLAKAVEDRYGAMTQVVVPEPS